MLVFVMGSVTACELRKLLLFVRGSATACEQGDQLIQTKTETETKTEMLILIYVQCTWHRRRIELAKAKVIALDWGTESLQRSTVCFK